MSSRAADVVVVGGGAIGLSAAWRLALRGASVILIERGEPGRGSTWAAAGMLSPLGETGRAGAFLRLASASLDLWPGFADEIFAATGRDVEYRRCGRLHVILDPADASELDRLMASGDAFGSEHLGAAEARRLEPALSPAVLGAVSVRRDDRVDSRALGAALLAATEAAGADIRTGTSVRGLCSSGSGAALRIDGVILEDGARIAAGAVIVAAGAWSALLEGLPSRLPVAPVRGQMFSVDWTSATGGPARPERMITTPHCYLVPRDSGHLLVGASVERVDFRPGPTPGGIAALAHAAASAVPAIADLPLVETWAGFRPGTPDGLPILGADPSAQGLFHATGHFRNGILLSPLTADVLARLVSGEPVDPSLDAFSIGRFKAA